MAQKKKTKTIPFYEDDNNRKKSKKKSNKTEQQGASETDVFKSNIDNQMIEYQLSF